MATVIDHHDNIPPNDSAHPAQTKPPAPEPEPLPQSMDPSPFSLAADNSDGPESLKAASPRTDEVTGLTPAPPIAPPLPATEDNNLLPPPVSESPPPRLRLTSTIPTNPLLTLHHPNLRTIPHYPTPRTTLHYHYPSPRTILPLLQPHQPQPTLPTPPSRWSLRLQSTPRLQSSPLPPPRKTRRAWLTSLRTSGLTTNQLPSSLTQKTHSRRPPPSTACLHYPMCRLPRHRPTP
ncbi:hypothetical protein Pst134EA_013954 [Puccinia striiformis f. sp. tritici]|uniref:hypothetical protein n=1 Tax=Puccinia striiformis f. sp. tritici TaxID=168172 RepID=UPI0020081D25|nr:hypothetical protein Pst134EA_013954 [Puccinia striiformis f. sp. tritici]KAH9466108.1 hypothetical protein Pst134EA_013954 [Puccinia striiformis f. sp. tritici]